MPCYCGCWKAYTARLRPGSRVAQAYGTTEISERHRHRWEVSNAYRDVLAEYGLRLSGQSPDGGLVETIEALGIGQQQQAAIPRCRRR